MKKLSELEDSEKYKIQNEVTTSANMLGMDDWRDNKSFDGNKLDGFGICACCQNFGYARTEFAIVVAKCFEHDIRLHSQNPIKECTNYKKKGELSLAMMFGMAVLIDKPKNKIGFE